MEVKIIRVTTNSQTKRMVTTMTVSKVTVMMRGVSLRENLRRNRYCVVPVQVCVHNHLWVLSQGDFKVGMKVIATYCNVLYLLG